MPAEYSSHLALERQVEQLGRAFRQCLPPRVEADRERQELLPRHVVVDAGLAGQVAGAPSDLQRAGVRIAAQDLELARIPPEQPDQEPQERRLAGAVRSDEADDLPRVERQIERVERHLVAERPPHAVRVDHPRHATRSRNRRSSAAPSSVRNDSGWNCRPNVGSSRWRIDISTPSGVQASATKGLDSVSSTTDSE